MHLRRTPINALSALRLSITAMAVVPESNRLSVYLLSEQLFKPQPKLCNFCYYT